MENLESLKIIFRLDGANLTGKSTAVGGRQLLMIEMDNTSIESVYSTNYVPNRQYENCISLGWFCGVASSMSRYGLRSHSGPFDWYFSDLESVLNLMETDFSDFMKRDNLFVNDDSPLVFRDRHYGFVCNHDIEYDFETEYEKIYQKYIRRAEWFMQAIKKPTCFIRALRSEQEVLYIEENRQYIYDVVKKDNADNEIIFLLLNTMKELPDDFLWFRLGIGQYIGKEYEMRTMFDTSEEFSKYSRHYIFPENIMEENKKFDRKSLRMTVKVSMIITHLDDYDVASVLRDYYPNIDEGIYLFGAGNFGELFSLYLITQKIRMKGIIDNNQDKQGYLCNGIPVISFLQVKCDYQNICIVVSDKFTDEIEEQILNQYPNTRILSLRKIIKLLEEKGGVIF